MPAKRKGKKQENKIPKPTNNNNNDVGEQNKQENERARRKKTHKDRKKGIFGKAIKDYYLFRIEMRVYILRNANMKYVKSHTIHTSVNIYMNIKHLGFCIIIK